jgi:hypothetical protein
MTKNKSQMTIDIVIILEDKIRMDEVYAKNAFVIGMKCLKHERIKMHVARKKSPDK